MTKLILTTALALLASTALASAQGMQPAPGNDTQRATPAPSAQQHAPAEKMTPSGHHAQAPGRSETTGQASGNDEMKNGTESGGKAEMKSGHGMEKGAAKSETKSNDKAEMKSGTKSSSDKAEMNSKSETNKAESAQDKTRTNARSEEHQGKSQTTGQGAAGAKGAASLSTEQRTKIRTVFKEKVHVQPVTHVNFSINVGTRVPRTVHYHPLPADVVEVYPAWRGYNFILVNDEIVIIDPATFEIVAVLT